MTRTAVTALIAALAAAGWGQGASAQEITGAEAGWAAMARCAAIAQDGARHACADEVMRKAGLLASDRARAEAKTAERRKTFGLQLPPPRPAPAPKAPAPVKQASAAPAAKAAKPAKAPAPPPVEDENSLEVTLAKVVMDGEGKLVLTTSEGAVWRQVESVAVRPEPASGQKMVIQGAALGGFLCKPNRWTSFRCIRRN